MVSLTPPAQRRLSVYLGSVRAALKVDALSDVEIASTIDALEEQIIIEVAQSEAGETDEAALARVLAKVDPPASFEPSSRVENRFDHSEKTSQEGDGGTASDAVAKALAIISAACVAGAALLPFILVGAKAPYDDPAGGGILVFGSAIAFAAGVASFQERLGRFGAYGGCSMLAIIAIIAAAQA